jgi:hypothetical protein
MGSAVLVLSILGIAIIWYNPGVLRSHSLKALVPLAICAALLAVFALSSKMTLGGETDPYPRPFLAAFDGDYFARSHIWALYLAITLSIR